MTCAMGNIMISGRKVHLEGKERDTHTCASYNLRYVTSIFPHESLYHLPTEGTSVCEVLTRKYGVGGAIEPGRAEDAAGAVSLSPCGVSQLLSPMPACASPLLALQSMISPGCTWKGSRKGRKDRVPLCFAGQCLVGFKDAN